VKSIGTIARPAPQLRRKPASRLQNGRRTDVAIRRLSALPDVRSLLKSQFESLRVTHQNLSEWKTGAFFDGQRSRQFCDSVCQLIAPPSASPTESDRVRSNARFSAVPEHFTLMPICEGMRQRKTLSPG